MDERESLVEMLRATMLRCVVANEPLPGTERRVGFPDLAFITESPVVLISQENLSGEFEPGDIGKPARVVPHEDVREEAEREGDLAYVYFQPPAWTDGERVRITMEVRVAPKEPDLHPLGLGGISATFAEVDGRWVVVEGPVIAAM